MKPKPFSQGVEARRGLGLSLSDKKLGSSPKRGGRKNQRERSRRA